ncbi:hypothetical protein ACMU_02425 [Actibacterium mucosum KCTC 23349]|uniref:YjiS-like domain-containing protein n=1 Tax=Actibacterium mucosum KCTC 23349 TaxID=1454373 RepID=A0A037ZPA0_9RHOB|nr:DUF1127 domain-containing protein [Actibacterium mucosum]KAJ57378.1 hypothetical protein ACMU_02425 [Actibacterium mucosum KCTC 23349]
MANVTENLGHDFGIARAFNNLRANIAAAAARRAIYNQTVRELSALSGRELADLGISRSEIRFLAKQAAEQH